MSDTQDALIKDFANSSYVELLAHTKYYELMATFKPETGNRMRDRNSFAVTPSETAYIKLLANIHGMSISEYIRYKLFDCIEAVEPNGIFPYLKQIRHKLSNEPERDLTVNREHELEKKLPKEAIIESKNAPQEQKPRDYVRDYNSTTVMYYNNIPLETIPTDTVFAEFKSFKLDVRQRELLDLCRTAYLEEKYISMYSYYRLKQNLPCMDLVLDGTTYSIIACDYVLLVKTDKSATPILKLDTSNWLLSFWDLIIIPNLKQRATAELNYANPTVLEIDEMRRAGMIKPTMIPGESGYDTPDPHIKISAGRRLYRIKETRREKHLRLQEIERENALKPPFTIPEDSPFYISPEDVERLSKQAAPSIEDLKIDLAELFGDT
jgi:hypothetical protein